MIWLCVGRSFLGCLLSGGSRFAQEVASGWRTPLGFFIVYSTTTPPPMAGRGCQKKALLFFFVPDAGADLLLL